jgi:TonB-linked SusC/RagA family outer membrane protein
MTIAPFRTLTRSLFSLGLLLGSAGSLAAQGIVSGRVTDQANGSALVGARVVVVGTSLTASTNADGRYRIAGVPAGSAQVRASQIGYASSTKGATVPDQGAVTLDFGLTLTPYSLDEVVVTATGDLAKREVGNAVSTVEVTDLVKTTPIANMNDLLVAKAPGVQVLPGNLTGGGARVRIRGNSSLSLSNNPIYVVDGIRVTSDVNSSSIGIGGTNPSRVNDLNPEDIESIDIVRGPSASTLYGTDAANGVIVIKTKKGKAGKPVWNAYVEQGAIKDNNTYPLNYRAWTAGSTVSNSTQCSLSGVATPVTAQRCVQDSVTTFQPWRDRDASPLSTGHRQQYGLQVSGGTDAIRYYVAGEWEDEIGVLRMPNAFEQRLLASRNLAKVPYEQLHPNGLRKTNVRANLSVNLGEKADVQVNNGFVTSTQRLPQTDNNTTGLGSNLYGGPGFKHNIITPATGVASRDNLGYRLYTPDDFFSETVKQDINRTINSGTFNYRPTSWLAMRVVGGLDFISREDSDLCRRDECTYFGFNINDPSVGGKAGYKANNRSTFFNYTGDVNATASYRMGSDVGAKTIIGGQYGKEKFARNGAFAAYLPPGATTVTAGAKDIFADETTTISATLGFFAEQSFSYKDRLYFTAAFRSDKNSAFGKQFQRVYYPKASLSYVLSDEAFFPKSDLLTSFRLRGAYGASGRQPGPNDAIPFLVPVTATVEGVDAAGLVVSALGNADLKPERSAEVELGFDAGLFRSKVNFEFTYYKKTSRDALIARTLAPSAGTAASRLENIGKTQNEGIEATLNASIIDTRSVGWEVTLSGSYNKGKILSLGGNPPNRGTTNSDLEGYPIQGWWLRPYTYQDKNNNGIIEYYSPTSTAAALNEIFVGDTTVYVGPPLPPGEFTAYNTIDLFNRKLRIQGLVDAKVGGYQLNGNERIRCQSRNNCQGQFDPRAPLDVQAAAVAVRQTPSLTQYGYVQKTDFLRFRELSVTYTVPDAWAHYFAASRVSLTASGRNLGMITKYKGIDPESGYFGTNIGVVSDFQTAPPATYFTFRLNVAF